MTSKRDDAENPKQKVGILNSIYKNMQKKTKLAFTILALGASLHFSSCTNEIEHTDEALTTIKSEKVFTPEAATVRFSEILSKATFNNQDVRKFLKEEAIKQFDKNYDVLYAKVKDYTIGDKTFEEILSEYSSAEEMNAIFNAIPRLNIYIPNISVLNINAENLDCSDSEIPVTFAGKNSNRLYLNGNVVDSIEIGDIPGFHVFVVNNNSRVNVTSTTRSNEKSYEFIAEEFNGEIPEPITRSAGISDTATVEEYMLDQKVKTAYDNYFNKDDGSIYQKSLQRDYIYYGMTPSSKNSGEFNRSARDYLFFIEINPNAYSKMTQKKENYEYTDDPEIKKDEAWRKKRDFYDYELVNEFWTVGAYNIKMETIVSTSSVPIVKYIPVKPEDIWDFHLDRSYRHSTMFRSSKYTYRINANKFTAKRYYLKNPIAFEKWDLSQEALSREIRFYETDPGESVDIAYTFEYTRMNNNKLNGSFKYCLGLGEKNNNEKKDNKKKSQGNIEINVNDEYTYESTRKETKVVNIKVTNNDDDLGMETVHFYDPIIVSKTGNKYNVKKYSTGIVTFGITAK